MSTTKIVVKWGHNKYDVDLDTSAPVSAFKQQLQQLTGVPCDRQKSLSSFSLLHPLIFRSCELEVFTPLTPTFPPFFIFTTP